MTAISGTLTNNIPSPDFTPTNSISDIVVYNISRGLYRIEAKAPNMTKYVPILSKNGSQTESLAVPISTSDPAIVYRIRSLVPVCEIEYYFGA